MDQAAGRRYLGLSWVLPGPEGVRVGVTPDALAEAGVPLAVELPAVGERLTAGSPCVQIDASKSAVDLEAPVSGVVVAVNHRLSTAPEVLGEDPLGEGWLYAIRPDAP